jgi:hypothetical protein
MQARQVYLVMLQSGSMTLKALSLRELSTRSPPNYILVGLCIVKNL